MTSTGASVRPFEMAVVSPTTSIVSANRAIGKSIVITAAPSSVTTTDCAVVSKPARAAITR